MWHIDPAVLSGLEGWSPAALLSDCDYFERAVVTNTGSHGHHAIVVQVIRIEYDRIIGSLRHLAGQPPNLIRLSFSLIFDALQIAIAD